MFTLRAALCVLGRIDERDARRPWRTGRGPMDTKRRHVVGGAAALALVSASSAAFAQKKNPVPGNASADPTDFEAALRSKFSTGDVLNWTGGNVRLKRPIVIDVTKSMIGPGVDLNGAKVIADFNDATRRAITIRIPGSSKN